MNVLDDYQQRAKELYNNDKVSIFKNKYFHGPGKSVLIIELQEAREEIEQEDEPYICTASRKEIGFLLEYFSNENIHKTNCLPLSPLESKSEKFEADINKFKPLFNDMLNNFIKPKILLACSQQVSEYLKKEYDIELYSELKGSKNIWKGIIKIGVYYYPVYGIADLENTDIETSAFEDFMLSTLGFIGQVCSHCNDLISKNLFEEFPQNPLLDNQIRASLVEGRDVSSFSLQIFLPEELSKFISTIKDFDEYDIIMYQELNSNIPQTSGFDPEMISEDNYCKLRKSKSSKIICEEYIKPERIEYLISQLKVIMIKYYLYSKFPEESFEYDWKDVMVNVSNDGSNICMPKDEVFNYYEKNKKIFNP